MKKHEYANATWEDLVKEFETQAVRNIKTGAEDRWVKAYEDGHMTDRPHHGHTTVLNAGSLDEMKSYD